MKFSEKLTVLRKKQGLSQEQLASKLEVTRQTVYKWEAGINVPELEKIKSIAKIFNISYDVLLNDELTLEDTPLSVTVEKTEKSDTGSVKKLNKLSLVIISISILLSIAIIVIGIVLIVNDEEAPAPTASSPAGTLASGVLTPDNCTHNSLYITSHTVKKPTCKEEGIERHVCSLCDYFYDTAIEKTPHKSYTESIFKEATYTEKGIKRFTCTGCDHYYDEEYSLSYNVSVSLIERSTGTEVVALVTSQGYTGDVTVTLSASGTVLASQAVSIEAGKTQSVLFSASATSGDGAVVATLPSTLDDRAPVTVSIDTIYDDNLEDNRKTSTYIYAVNLKIAYISTYITEENGEKKSKSALYTAITVTGYTVKSENMFSSLEEFNGSSSFDLYIFENLAPAALPQDGAVWLLNPPTVPSGAGIAIEDIQVPADASYRRKINIAPSAIPAIVKNVTLHPISLGDATVYAELAKWREITELGALSKILTADTNTVMAAGELNGNKLIVTSFDIKDSSLPFFLTDFPILIKNMLQYSLLPEEFSAE
ncbi:MAG: helix-turn-helix transcriptional regulator [Clostridia bacterium]|nr:helix-turn-helix transcriptional regulator [Clostridia bacterium]